MFPLLMLISLQSLPRMETKIIAFSVLLLLVAHCSAAHADAADGDRNCPKFWVDGTFVGMGRKHLSEILIQN